MGWIDATRARLRLLLARGTAESRMEEEMRLHLELEAERLAREEGLDSEEAWRRARVAFGGQDRYREELRDGRGLAWLSGLRLDLKLGVRMLLKFPVLTLASVLALAAAVALAASWFQFMSNMALPRIPLADADRIVTLRNLNLASADRDFSGEPRSLHDFELWREELESIEHLSAASPVEYTVRTEVGRFGTLDGVRATPSMFRVARVQPLLGRSFTAADDQPGAAPVVVIAYSAWQRLFDGDRSSIGETVRLGSEYATVIGVMPEGFGFPLNEEIWVPLRESALNYARREGPPIRMFGRLAAGYSLEQAEAELATIGRRSAEAFPQTHEHLRPEVRRFGPGGWESTAAVVLNVPFLLFLIVVSANVATLLFARTATRESEIALRSALGASRRRIVVQLVAEALVLTALATALGLAAARWGIGAGMDLFWEVQQMRPPFWFDAGLSAPTVLYAAALALLGALIIGGIPGLRATRPQLRNRLAQPGAGGSGMRFGAVATGVIVVQVALCVAFIPVAIMNGQELLPDRSASDFPAEAYLTGRITYQLEPQGPVRSAQAGQQADEQQTAQLIDNVRRRLAAEPGVIAATRASRLPGFNHPIQAIQIDGDSARIIEARPVAVDPNFFEAMDARIVSGRGFSQGDVAADNAVAIVDQAWARETFGGRSPLGRRIRYPDRDEEQGSRWYEIVGVVAGMDRAVGPGTRVAVFHPLRPEEHASVQVYLRTASLPDALAPQVREVITSVDASLGVTDLKSLAEVWRPVERSDRFFAAALAVVAAIILLFALIGIYALMSFAVTKRAREIGIRAALGANPRRIIVAIFSRAMTQIGIGVIAGAALVSLTVARSPEGVRLVGGVAAAIVAVGLIACVVPAMRALRIQPTDALRAE